MRFSTCGVLHDVVRAVLKWPIGWLRVFQSPTAVREGIFTASYLGLKPVIQEDLTIWPGRSLKDRPTLTTFLAAATSGLLSAVVTHPFDTIKTRMQANLDLPMYR